MTHELCRDSLGAWLDGELTPPAATAVAEHVGACAACRAAADEIRALSASLRALPRHEIPSDLKARLLRGDEAAPRRASWRSPWALASLASAAAAAILVIGVIGLRRPEAPRIARLDAPAGKDGSEAVGQAPAQEPVPAAPQPPRQAAERFALTPPAAPDDRPTERDENAPASGPADDARADAGKMQAIETLGHSDAASPAEELKKSAIAPETRERAVQAANPLTYIARLVADSEGGYHLEQVEPPPAAAGIKEEIDHSARMAAAASPESSAGAPAVPREGEAAPAPSAAAAAPAPATLMFLVELDAVGNITSARLVGARTTSSEVVEAARTLLIGSRFPGRAMGRLSHATVQVLVDDPAPAR